MTNGQWTLLLDAVKGKSSKQALTGFIIDSPWLPGWAGISTIDYYASDEIWFRANMQAIEAFPGIIFLPGFWSEYGMCTEPSAFGAKMIWNELSLPHAEKILDDISGVDRLKVPDPSTDGLLPFVTGRLVRMRKAMNEAGHFTRFAVSRGPLNIASFLLGTTGFMTAVMMDPEKAHRLLRLVTEFCVRWIQYQKKLLPEIEGILVLDDLVGFLGEEECREFAVPYIREVFSSIDSRLNFFHNDAHGLICAPYLREMGVDLFNFSFEHPMSEIRDLAGPEVALLGNLPPRDVLASGTESQVREETVKMVKDYGRLDRVVWSCGGGMPPGVGSANIRAFVDTVNSSFPPQS